MNLFFILISYFSVSQMLSKPMPLDYNIPFFINESVFDEGVPVQYFQENPEHTKIRLLLNYKKNVGFYEINYNVVLLNELREAYKQSSQQGEGEIQIIIKRDLTRRSFSVESLNMKSNPLPKNTMDYSNGVEHYQVR